MQHARTFNAAHWTILTTAGLAGGIVAGAVVGSIPPGSLLNAMFMTALLTCVVGVVLGVCQALGLRGLLAKPSWWIAATVIGLGAGLALGVVTVEQTGILVTGVRPRVAFLSPAMRTLSFATVGLVAGAILGIAQWIVLRKQHSPVRRWIFVSALALGGAFCFASLLIAIANVQFASAAGRIAFLALSGVLFGVLTSGPLRRAALTQERA